MPSESQCSKVGNLNCLQKRLQWCSISKLQWTEGILPSMKIGPRELEGCYYTKTKSLSYHSRVEVEH